MTLCAASFVLFAGRFSFLRLLAALPTQSSDPQFSAFPNLVLNVPRMLMLPSCRPDL